MLYEVITAIGGQSLGFFYFAITNGRLLKKAEDPEQYEPDCAEGPLVDHGWSDDGPDRSQIFGSRASDSAIASAG